MTQQCATLEMIEMDNLYIDKLIKESSTYEIILLQVYHISIYNIISSRPITLTL